MEHDVKELHKSAANGWLQASVAYELVASTYHLYAKDRTDQKEMVAFYQEKSAECRSEFKKHHTESLKT